MPGQLVLSYMQMDATTANNVVSVCTGLNVWLVSNFATNSQKHATSCNRVCKETHHVTSNNVDSCWPTKLWSFAFLMSFKVYIPCLSVSVLTTAGFSWWFLLGRFHWTTPWSTLGISHTWMLGHCIIVQSRITAWNSHKDGTLYQSLFFQNILR